MADLDDIKQAIQEIAQRPKNVTFEEIKRVVEQLGQLPGFTVRSRKTKHMVLFSINDRRFGVSPHNRGRKQVKPYAVKNFLVAMIELELFEEQP